MPQQPATYERLAQQALAVLREHQERPSVKAVAVLACVGFEGGSVVATTVRSAAADAAVPLAMLLAATRSHSASDPCAHTRRELERAAAALERAIAYKLLPPSPAALLH